jgi:hypothetical protein
LIKEITQFSFTAKNEEAKIRVLMVLNGVSWPIASALLHFAFPSKYPILDFRAIWSLGWEKPTVYSFDFWRSYCDKINTISQEVDLPIRTVDKALWEYSKQNQNVSDIRIERPPTTNRTFYYDIRIPPELLARACLRVGEVPRRLRGIQISERLVGITMEILNEAPDKILPQNCRNDIREKTPDGLDRKIKERFNDDLRRANIISDVLADAGIVEVIEVRNPGTERNIKGTRLLPEWYW